MGIMQQWGVICCFTFDLRFSHKLRTNPLHNDKVQERNHEALKGRELCHCLCSVSASMLASKLALLKCKWTFTSAIASWRCLALFVPIFSTDTRKKFKQQFKFLIFVCNLFVPSRVEAFRCISLSTFALSWPEKFPDVPVRNTNKSQAKTRLNEKLI